MPGAEPSIAGNASTSELEPRLHAGGAVAPTMPGTVRSLAAIRWASPPRSTSTSSGFITPGLMCASASIWRPAIAVPVPGKFLSCGSLGFSCVPKPASSVAIARPAAATGSGRRTTKRAQRPQAAVLGMAAVDEAARYDAKTVDALSKHGEERR